MDINFNWDLYDFGTEKIKFRLKVAYECFNHRYLGAVQLYRSLRVYGTLGSIKFLVRSLDCAAGIQIRYS